MNTIKRFALLLATVLLTAGLAMSTFAQEDEYVVSQAELDQLLAPIALYPGTVLSHILIASTYPLEVVEAERWAQRNPSLTGNNALDAVESKTWDPSVKALTPFPQILKRMSDDLQWIQAIGDAFLHDEELVLTSVQDLRNRAYDNGALKDLDHMRVVKDDGNIVIESRVKEVVYVPYYDTRVVYGPWRWNNYPPVYWSGVHTGLSFFWGPRVRVGTGIYFSSFQWNRRHVVVVDRKLHSRHRFYSGRHVSRHSSSKRWAHNPSHRRGVSYRSAKLKTRYSQSRNIHRAERKKNLKQRQASNRNNVNQNNVNQNNVNRNTALRNNANRNNTKYDKRTDKRKAQQQSQRQISAKKNNSRNDKQNAKLNKNRNDNGNDKRTAKRTSEQVTKKLRQEPRSSIHQRSTQKRQERSRDSKESRQTRYSAEKRNDSKSNSRQKNDTQRSQTSKSTRTVNRSEKQSNRRNVTPQRANKDSQRTNNKVNRQNTRRAESSSRNSRNTRATTSSRSSRDVRSSKTSHSRRDT